MRTNTANTNNCKFVESDASKKLLLGIRCLVGVRRNSLQCFVLSAMLLASPVSALASDSGQSGWATFIGTNPMSLQWNVEIDTILKTSLVNSNGIVTVAVSGGFDIICIDNATGNILWKTRSPNQLSGVPEISATRGLIISSTKLGEIVAYSIKTGERAYSASTGWDESTSPALSETRLLVKGFNREEGKSGISAINIDTGKILWITASAISSQPPCADDGMVYVCEKSGIKAVRESDGFLAWRNDLPFAPDFVASRGRILAITSGKDIHFLSQGTGRVDHSKAFDSEITQPPTFFDGICHVVTDKGKTVSSFDITTGTDIWSSRTDTELFQPQVWNKGLILASKNCIQFVERETGKLLWDVSATGTICANPIAVIDYLIIPTSLKLYAYRNAGFEIQVLSSSIDLGLLTSDEPFGQSNLQVFNRSGSIQRITCESESPWLKVSPNTFEIKPHDSIELQFTADMREEPIGSYASKVFIAWASGLKELAIEARKVRPEEAKPPKPGRLSIEKTDWDFSARLGQPNPSFALKLSNTGDMEVDWFFQTNSPWILISNPSDSLRGKESKPVVVCLVTARALMGKNEGIITAHSKTGGQAFEISITFWRDPGTMKVVAEFEMGSSVAAINSLKVRARPEPFASNNDVMIPLSFARLLLDCGIEETDGGVFKILRGNTSVIVTLNSATAEVFSPSKMEKFKLGSPAVLKRGCVVIPLDLIRFAFDGKVAISGKNHILELNLEEL